MRTITHLVVHCSATPPDRNIRAADIRKTHVEYNQWKDIGYHYVIGRDGRLEFGRPESEVGAHVSGYNQNTLGICLVGGVDGRLKPQANYTPAQKEKLIELLRALTKKYPRAEVCGHRDFPGVKKACPCFDAGAWWAGVKGGADGGK